MQNRIITISRQYGSGGRLIGQALAKRLGIPFYDREMIALAAEQSGISGNLFIQPEQTGGALSCDCFATAAVPSLGDKVYLAQRCAIQALAEKGPSVIVGRGAAAVLKGAVPLLNVFIYADLETRKRRAVEEYGDSPHKIEAHIAAIDQKRAAYFRFYAGLNARQMENYHLCIDSGFTGIDDAVTLIAAAYQLGEKE